MRVAFLGLGIMGQAMATNLVKAGHEVTVWNRTPGKLVDGCGGCPVSGGGRAGSGGRVALRFRYRRSA
jgi:3-hydroxyisobutyrate dehydrogenase-like beta-hydroxyacid dehydrogenase